jgi:peroxidase
MRRFFIFNPWIIVAFIVFLPVLVSLKNPRGEPEPENTITQTTPSSFSSVMLAANTFPFDFNQRIRDGSNLQYNFYRDSCPQAEDIVRSAVTDIYFDHRDLAPSLLRLFFHDCFIQVYLIFLLTESK